MGRLITKPNVLYQIHCWRYFQSFFGVNRYLYLVYRPLDLVLGRVRKSETEKILPIVTGEKYSLFNWLPTFDSITPARLSVTWQEKRGVIRHSATNKFNFNFDKRRPFKIVDFNQMSIFTPETRYKFKPARQGSLNSEDRFKGEYIVSF